MARTMTVALGPHYENFIQSTITSGRYNNASEVVRAALRRLEDDEARLAALRSAIDEGDSSSDVEDFNRDRMQKILFLGKPPGSSSSRRLE